MSNLNSTAAATEDAITTPPQEPGNIKTRIVFMAVEDPEGFIARDQTGMFPKTSKEGMKYICVFYIFDPNFIKGIPLKSIKKEELLCVKPQLHKIDNEASKDVEDFIAIQQIIQQ